jgi:hypothetical protein
MEVKDPPEILIFGYTLKHFSNKSQELKDSSIILFKIFKQIIEKN